MMVKLTICLCICLVVFLSSIAGVNKGLDFTDSEKPNVQMFGTVLTVASAMFMGASFGVIVFAIKLFVFICIGRTV